ncbi:MAG: hypothetical protein KIS61_04425 [Candidatus Eremiobacteraeota bacterium]|nr:hypothetical protein [Candidatus Eremiobacteraeota bacterium]
MARFHFQVSDTEGKIRRGTMEAQSLSDAREIAHRRGYTVIELREVVDGAPEPAIKVQTKSATSRYHTGPAEARAYRPGLLQRLQDLFPVHTVRAVMAVLIVVGLVWMVAGWRTPGARNPGSGPSRAPATPNLTALKLQVEGSVEVVGSSSLGDVQITVDLPEIPYQQTYDWTKLKHPRPGHFLVDVEFESTRKARQLIVHARKPGLGEASTEVIRIIPQGGKHTNLKLVIKPGKPS